MLNKSNYEKFRFPELFDYLERSSSEDLYVAEDVFGEDYKQKVKELKVSKIVTFNFEKSSYSQRIFKQNGFVFAQSCDSSRVT